MNYEEGYKKLKVENEALHRTFQNIKEAMLEYGDMMKNAAKVPITNFSEGNNTPKDLEIKKKEFKRLIKLMCGSVGDDYIDDLIRPYNIDIERLLSA